MTKPFRCPVCRTPLVEDVDAGFKIPPECPYRYTSYPELCARHDKLYFGKWRKMEADPNDIKRAYGKLAELLAEMSRIIEAEDVEAARRDLANAEEAFARANAADDPYASVRHMDQALSYVHHAIDDLLKAREAKPHSPSDYERHYDVILPFKEDL